MTMFLERQARACYHGLAMRANRWIFLPTGWAASLTVHAVVLLVLLVASRHRFVEQDTGPVVREKFQFHWASPGGPGGGGGGVGGDLPRAATDSKPEETREPRRAPIAPRTPRPLSFDDLNVPDLPDEAARLLEGVFSPDAVDSPGLSLTDPRDWGGIDVGRSSGRLGGLGGGDGTGIGSGRDSGVGPGSKGGSGDGDQGGGGWDTDPVPIYKPPNPVYPAPARERMIRGEVIVRVLVKVDGSTEVLSVLKSLPHCVDTALANAKLWRWKPARRNGRPVEAFGIITVTFDILTRA